MGVPRCPKIRISGRRLVHHDCSRVHLRRDPPRVRVEVHVAQFSGRGERPAGRAELLAKKGCIGQMQRPAELVPIPEYLLSTSLVPPESSQKSRENFVKI